MTEYAYDGVRVAGIRYRMSDALDFLDEAEQGHRLDLEPEPDNQFDEYAVRVVGCGRHIGYLPAPLSELLAYKGARPTMAHLVNARIDVRRKRVSIEIKVLAEG